MKLLWLSSRLMYPLDNGGKIRTYNLLRHLSQQHRITIVTLADRNTKAEDIRAVEQVCDTLVTVPSSTARRFSPRFLWEVATNLGSNLPYSIARYRSANMARIIRQQLGRTFFDLLVCDFLPPTVNMALRDRAVPRILFQHNVEAVVWKRLHEKQTDSLRRRYFKLQWQRMRDYEARVCRDFDHVIAVSDVDRDTLRDHYALKEISVVPTGVDTHYFAPQPAAEEEAQLVFTGAMDWMPNEDAILFLAEHILPRVRECVPNVRMTVVGHSPTAPVLRALRAVPSCRATGRVPDVRPYIARATAYVVPLRMGGGTRLKIFEAMSMGKTIVSTTVGAEGLPTRHAENILLADQAPEFAARVVEALTDRTLRQRIGRAARKLVEENYDWKQVANQFARVCSRVCGEE